MPSKETQKRAEFRVVFPGGRIGRTVYETLEEARASKRIEFFWGDVIGEIQQKVGDEWVRTEDQRLFAEGERSKGADSVH